MSFLSYGKINTLEKEKGTTMNKITTIIFDLDGTVLDTLTDITNALNKTLSSFNKTNRTPLEVRSFLGNGAKVLVKKSLNNNEEELETIYQAYVKNYESNTNTYTKPYDGIMELLNTLKQDYKLAIVSNKHQEAVDKIIASIFPNIFSYVIGERKNIKKKPEPDMLLLAIHELNSKIEETIFIGDSEVDIETARNANVKSVGVTWGFRDKKVIIEENPNYIIDRPNELLDILNSL